MNHYIDLLTVCCVVVCISTACLSHAAALFSILEVFDPHNLANDKIVMSTYIWEKT